MVLEAAGSSPVSHPSEASFVFAANEAFFLVFEPVWAVSDV